MTSMPPRVRCREIEEADRTEIADLLTRGFHPQRSRAFWLRAFDSLSAHRPPPGCPRYGYVLVSGGTIVGTLLAIFACLPGADGPVIRCNLSSWYVEPAFRSYSTLLVSRATKRRDVTYLNVTPAPHTYPILEAQGYRRYCEGRFASVPLLSRARAAGRAWTVTPDTKPGPDLSETEVGLLVEHERFGCLSVLCGVDGAREPFVFASRRKGGLLPFAILVYCRGLESFVRCARPLGIHLARRGVLSVVLDANGPVAGPAGVYLEPNPKYAKGDVQPRLGDIAYSERALFGV